jgi:hypothetical protein
MERVCKSSEMEYEEIAKVPLGKLRRSLHDDISIIVVDLQKP